MTDEPETFDAVVVGSGFGGAVSAYRLADDNRRVCVLERGREWPPMEFPRSPADVSENVWDPSAGHYGMFNFWSFRNMEALVASGLGGGSLIYANVLLQKPKHWFADEDGNGQRRRWPLQFDDLLPHYKAVEEVLQPVRYPYDDTPKTAAFAAAADRLGFMPERPPMAVTFCRPGEQPARAECFDSDNRYGRTRQTCHLCGECIIGCNYGAKNTLDFNYLTMAEKAGADIRSGSEVVALSPDPEEGFLVEYVKHDTDDPPRVQTHTLPRHCVRARQLVLAAGSLGTTYLLLRNRSAFPALSPCLGTRFSGNGDLFGFVVRAAQRLDPAHGPVITSTIHSPDFADGGHGPGLYVQDGGYPEFVNWIVAGQLIPSRVATLLRSAVRMAWRRLSGDPRSDLSGELGRLIPGKSTASVLPLLAMGRDTPDGVMCLRAGYLDITWHMRTSKAYFTRAEDTMRHVASELGGEFKRMPLSLLKRVLTVHPLGGCPMGFARDDGVVNSFGEVFGYPGMYIADGSVMPGPVEPNPALTIAALADRFADDMTR